METVATCSLVAWTDLIQFATALLALVVTGLAVWGVNTWRKEHVGKRRVDTAEEILEKTYEALDVIRAMRHSVSYGAEHDRIERMPDESDEQYQHRSEHQLARLRYLDAASTFARLSALRYRAKVHFGDQVAKAIQEINNIALEVIDAADDLIRQSRMSEPMRDSPAERARRSRLEAIRTTPPANDPDPLQARIKAVCSTIEDRLEPYIKA